MISALYQTRCHRFHRTQPTRVLQGQGSTTSDFKYIRVSRTYHRVTATAKEAPVVAPKRTWTIPLLLQGLCLGVGLLVGGCHVAKRVDVWESWAECAEGLVLELEDHADMETFWGRLNPHHDLKIGFREGEGEVYDRQYTFYTAVGPYKHRKTFERVHADRLAARLVVLYDPDNPQDCRLADQEHTNLAQLMIYVGVWTTLLCTLALAVRIVDRAQAAAVAAAGAVALASSGGGGGSGGSGSGGGGSASSLLLLDDRAAFGAGPADPPAGVQAASETGVVGLASAADANASSSSRAVVEPGAFAEELEAVAVDLKGSLDSEADSGDSRQSQELMGSYASSTIGGDAGRSEGQAPAVTTGDSRQSQGLMGSSGGSLDQEALCGPEGQAPSADAGGSTFCDTVQGNSTSTDVADV